MLSSLLELNIPSLLHRRESHFCPLIPHLLAPKAGSLRVLLPSPVVHALEVRFGPDLVSANAAPCSGSPGRVQIWFGV